MSARDGWLLVSLEDRYALFVREGTPTRGADLAATSLYPGYALGWLVGATPEREAEIGRALEALPQHVNTDGYRAWTRALLALRPLLHRGGGMRVPADAAERALLERGLVSLRRAAAGAPRVPLVQAHHAMAAALACQLEEAERALAAASGEEQSRETLLTAQEIALRRGRVDEVAEFVKQARALPRSEPDVWLEAVAHAVDAPPTCP
jgi:hypothetical protein